MTESYYGPHSQIGAPDEADIELARAQEEADLWRAKYEALTKALNALILENSILRNKQNIGGSHG